MHQVVTMRYKLRPMSSI